MMESMMMMATATFSFTGVRTFHWLTLRRTESAEGCMYGSYPVGKPYAPHFSKKGTLEKFDNPAICLSDPQIASGASEPPRRCRKSNRKVFLLPVASETQKYRIASAQTI